MASEQNTSNPLGPLSPDIKTCDEGGGGCGLKAATAANKKVPATCTSANKPQSLDLAKSEFANGTSLPILLVTANVGSIFDDPHSLIPQWLTQVSLEIKAQKPAFVAIHCQEVSRAKNICNS